MKIYRILENGYYGGEIDLPDGTLGIPLYTTRTAPPVIPEGQFAIWHGSGQWVITSEPPPEPAPEPLPETTPEPAPEPLPETTPEPAPEQTDPPADTTPA